MNTYPTTQPAATVSRGRSAESVPADLDPTAYPILAIHWFGLEPPRPVGPIAADAVAGLRRQHQIEHVHRLGPRAVGELLHEVDAGADLDSALDAYERLTPDLLKAVGGDRFPALPISEVR